MRLGLVSLVLAGCCEHAAPTWLELEPVELHGDSVQLDLDPWVTGAPGDRVYTATTTSSIIAEIDGSQLTLTPQPDEYGEALVHLAVEDACGHAATTDMEVSHPEPAEPFDPADCATRITFRPPIDTPDAVTIAGDFNDWSVDADPLEPSGDGTWSVDLDLPPGSYAYGLVTHTDGDTLWQCDPTADAIQCDEGAVAPSATDWVHDCTPGRSECNSLIVVPPCGPPRLEVTRVDIGPTGQSARVDVSARPGAGGAIASAVATLDDEPLTGPWTDTPEAGFSVDLSDLSEGRHTLRFRVTDTNGNPSEEAYVPFWTEDRDPGADVMYFAFVDRMRNGDPTNDHPEGATATWGDYEGGDLRGLIHMLPYLDDLGVTVLWISNPQDNAEGTWAGDCDLSYAGYHAYWPDDPHRVEEHFGDEASLHELVDGAHARGMRVIMDWVANHVHETHPWVTLHPEWFTDEVLCTDRVDGQLNFDRLPETCWFAPYLPDLDTTRPDVLTAMVDDALWWATTYELDGFRVDAVKHVSRALTWNLGGAVRDRIEHRDVGGDEDFYTVGETFDGSRARIEAYVGPHQLDGQFDFPSYFALRDAFVADSRPVRYALESKATSEEHFTGRMSTFVGNHDVPRFVTDASQGDLGSCDGDRIRVASSPADARAYDRLKLAWTVVFTNPGVPLIYYGDELGLPGHADPDNRQPLWNHTGGDLAGVSSVNDLASRIDTHEASVLHHVHALSRARAAHPALWSGTRVQWWDDGWDLHAYTRSSGDDHALVVLNRSEQAHSMTNGLSFAGLPSEGLWRDVLTDETFVAADDQLTLDVAPSASRVLVLE